MTSTIDQLLADARRPLLRLEPEDAYQAVQRDGAVLIDVRPQANREAEGQIPGAIVIDRNVLEWRLDPTCAARLEIASSDLFPIIVCNEGSASSFAAASLHQIGLKRATDLVGGYRAWRSAGLPTTAGD